MKIFSDYVVLFHCRFGLDGPIYLKRCIDERTPFEAHRHAYAIYAINREAHPHRILFGILMKSTTSHEDPEFFDIMAAAMASVATFRARLANKLTMLSVPADDSAQASSEAQAHAAFSDFWTTHQACQSMLQ